MALQAFFDSSDSVQNSSVSASTSTLPPRRLSKGLSLRSRVMAVVAIVHLGVIILATWLLILNARTAVQEEVKASLQLARELSLGIITSRLGFDTPYSLIAALQKQLPHARHVRMTLLNSQGDILWPSLSAFKDSETIDGADVPVWFAEAIAPPQQRVTIPITLGLTSYGSLIIATEPLDEIDEVWTEFRTLMAVLIGALFLLLVVINLLLGWTLRPIASLSRGLETLERGHYAIRLPAVAVPELQQMAERFNALALRLEETTREKDDLAQQLVTLQDHERRAIAFELHDEFGPCLFGLRVDAHCIDKKALRTDRKSALLLADRAKGMIELTEQMQTQIRSMLRRLYPTTLGEVSIDHLLRDLVDGFQTRHPEIEWTLQTPDNPRSFGDTIDLTLYRAAQESLTNAVRHAEPTAVTVNLSLSNSDAGKAEAVHLAIQDDGKGLPPDMSHGIGLTSMNHRMRILRGSFDIDNRPEGGVIVCVSLPIATFNAADSSKSRALPA